MRHADHCPSCKVTHNVSDNLLQLLNTVSLKDGDVIMINYFTPCIMCALARRPFSEYRCNSDAKAFLSISTVLSAQSSDSTIFADYHSRSVLGIDYRA